MTFLFSIFFGAGLTTFVYTKAGRRVGYTNHQNIFILLGAVFILSTAAFYIALSTFIK